MMKYSFVYIYIKEYMHACRCIISNAYTLHNENIQSLFLQKAKNSTSVDNIFVYLYA